MRISSALSAVEGSHVGIFREGKDDNDGEDKAEGLEEEEEEVEDCKEVDRGAP
jgi:hypothetical protein